MKIADTYGDMSRSIIMKYGKFLVTECGMIPLKSDENSLILCDELTAGTETESATGIVASSIFHLLKKKTNTVFTTHLHSIMQFPEISINDDPDKVIYSWGAHVVDQETDQTYDIAVWDYKGSRWSTYGNPDVLERIFKCNSSEA